MSNKKCDKCGREKFPKLEDNENSELLSKKWEEVKIIPGVDPSDYRKDDEGTIIRRCRYGDTVSAFGWELDHKKPDIRDDPDNLRALHWLNNRWKKDDKYSKKKVKTKGKCNVCPKCNKVHGNCDECGRAKCWNRCDDK